MGQSHPFEIIREKRKTAVIRIYPDNRVVIRIPKRLSERELSGFLEAKQLWIETHVQKNAEKQTRRLARTYTSGDTFYYLGNPFDLQIRHGTKTSVRLYETSLLVTSPIDRPDHVQKHIEKWFATQAQDILEDRVQTFQQNISTPVNIRFRKMKSRWGSCSSKGSLCFNTALIMAPMDIVDYVVIHELCHLVHHNHSPLFWKLVKTHFPKYRHATKWLKENGFLLIF